MKAKTKVPVKDIAEYERMNKEQLLGERLQIDLFGDPFPHDRMVDGVLRGVSLRPVYVRDMDGNRSQFLTETDGPLDKPSYEGGQAILGTRMSKDNHEYFVWEPIPEE